MNLFVLDVLPENAARYHCDKHVVKMIVETAQMLSTVLRERGKQSVSGVPLYKATHANHPCTKWVAASVGNFDWALRLGLALLEEYRIRYGKRHKTTDLLHAIALAYPPTLFPTDFVMAMPEQFQNPKSVVLSYRTYIAASKHHFAKWAKATPEPTWWRERREYVINNNLEVENTSNDGISYR